MPAWAEQDLEHYIRGELLNVATQFTDLGRIEACISPAVFSQDFNHELLELTHHHQN